MNPVKMLKGSLFLAGMLAVGSLAYAQLVNVDRKQNHQMLIDNTQIQFGSLPDVVCEYDTAQTNDALVCGLSTDSERFILTQKADINTNFGLSDLGSPAITMMSAAGTKSVTIYHDGTNAVIDVDGGGSVTFPDGISASISPDGMMSFASGAAVTAGSYQIGRDNDGTNQLHFNVPTGAKMEWSINDVSIMEMSAIGLNLGNNNLSLGGTLAGTKVNAAGGSADAITLTGTLGIMNGSDTYNGFLITLTESNHTGVSNVVNGISIAGITSDPDATETAIKLGNGWDVGIDAGNNQIKTSGGLDLQGSNINGANSILANGDITSSDTGDMGWSIRTGADTACNTTCTFACVFGWETTAGEVAVSCSDATADKCLCAGAN